VHPPRALGLDTPRSTRTTSHRARDHDSGAAYLTPSVVDGHQNPASLRRSELTEPAHVEALWTRSSAPGRLLF